MGQSMKLKYICICWSIPWAIWKDWLESLPYEWYSNNSNGPSEPEFEERGPGLLTGFWPQSHLIQFCGSTLWESMWISRDSLLYVYQRVNLHFPTGFPMVFPLKPPFSYGFPLDLYQTPLLADGPRPRQVPHGIALPGLDGQLHLASSPPVWLDVHHEWHIYIYI